MGRVRQAITVGGRPCWTVFDPDERHTWVLTAVAARLTVCQFSKAFRISLGGQVKEAREGAILDAEIEGLPIVTHAMVVDEIGLDECGKPIEVLLGAYALRQWGIRVLPDEGRLDLTHYPDVFVEF